MSSFAHRCCVWPTLPSQASLVVGVLGCIDVGKDVRTFEFKALGIAPKKYFSCTLAERAVGRGVRPPTATRTERACRFDHVTPFVCWRDSRCVARCGTQIFKSKRSASRVAADALRLVFERAVDERAVDERAVDERDCVAVVWHDSQQTLCDKSGRGVGIVMRDGDAVGIVEQSVKRLLDVADERRRAELALVGDARAA